MFRAAAAAHCSAHAERPAVLTGRNPGCWPAEIERQHSCSKYLCHVQAEQITPAELRFELQRLHTAVLTQSALQSFLDANLAAGGAAYETCCGTSFALALGNAIR